MIDVIGVSDGSTFGPQVVPHGAGDLTVPRADPVAEPGEAHRERGHVEPLAAGVMMSEGQELLPGQSELRPEVAEVAVDQIRREDIVTGGYRGVRGEDRRRDDPLGRLVEGQSFRDPFADSLQEVKPGVALVAVPVDRIDAHGPQGAHAADAEDLFLPQPVFLVAAVEP